MLKQAIRTENFFTEEVKKGNKILIKNKDDSLKEVIFQR